jgi:hypothetical protein
VTFESVKLDATLVIVKAFSSRRKAILAVFPLLFALRRGKAHFKDVIAQGVDLDPASLPYDEAVLASSARR